MMYFQVVQVEREHYQKPRKTRADSSYFYERVDNVWIYSAPPSRMKWMTYATIKDKYQQWPTRKEEDTYDASKKLGKLDTRTPW